MSMGLKAATSQRASQIIFGYIFSIVVPIEIIYFVVWFFVGDASDESLFGHKFSVPFLGHLASFLYTAIFAFPGWFIGVLVAERFGIRSMIWFALGGALVGLSAMILKWAVIDGILYDSPSVNDLGPLISGFVGGLVYGMIAGKHSGTWKENA